MLPPQDIHKPQGATFVVAASDSLHRERADYVCGGVDDQVEIQAAIDALPMSGLVHLASGTYIISDTIQIKGIGTILEGEGATTSLGTRLYLADNSNCDMIEVMGGKNVVRSLWLDGNYRNQTSGNGIYAHGGCGQDFKASHMYTWDIKDTAFKSYGWHDVYIDVTPEHSGKGFWMQGTGGERNQFIGCDSYQNTIGFDIDSDRNIISGTIIRGGENGAQISGDMNIIDGCLFDGQGTYGLYIDGNYNKLSSSLFRDQACRGVWIRGGGCYNTLNDLTIRNTSQNTNGEFSAIKIETVGANTCTHNIISNCHIINDAANKPKYGIEEHTVDDDYNKIMNNVIEGFTIAGMLIKGPHDIWSEQYSNIFMDVLAVSATHVRENEDLSEAVPNTFTIDAQPDVPRTLSGHFDSHAQITAYTIVITGISAKGNAVTETFTEAASPWDFETVNAYATITSIIMTARTGSGAGDTMDIGITDVLGLSNIIYATGDVFKIKRNNANAVVAAAQVNTTYGTYDMAVIGLAATDNFAIWYKSNLNIIS